MKYSTLATGLLSLFFLFCFSACTDDDGDAPSQKQPVDGGIRYHLYDVAMYPHIEIPVYTTTEFQIEEVGTHYLSFEQSETDGHRLLTISCPDLNIVPPFSLIKIRVTVPGKFAAENAIILRNSRIWADLYTDGGGERDEPQAVTASSDDVTDEIIKSTNLSTKVGRTTNIATSGPEEGTGTIALDFPLLRYANKLVIDPLNSEELHIASGSNYEETHKEWSVSVGLGGFGGLGGKAKGWTLGGQFDFSRSESTASTKYNVYDRRDYVVQRFSAHILPQISEAFVPKAGATLTDEERVAAVDSLMKYANSDFISGFQIQIAKVTDSISAAHFLSVYGTHIITAGVFGGKMMSRYEMHQDSYAKSVSNSAGVQLYAKQAGEGFTDEKVKALLIIMGHSNASEIQATATGSNATSELIKNTKCNFDYKTLGADPNQPQDIGSIIKVSNSSAVMISYNTTMKADVNGVAMGLPSYGLIPIWELCFDANVRTLLEKAFYGYKRRIEERKPLILADVVYTYDSKQADPKENHNGDKYYMPYEADFQSAPGHVKTHLTYYPMVPNKEFSDYGRNDAVFDFMSKASYGCVYEGAGVFYYAFGREDEVDGITDIRFLKPSDAGIGYTKRGNGSHEGFKIVGRKDVRVYVKYGDLEARKRGGEKPAFITGMAITGSKDGEIFASTGGTTYTDDLYNGESIYQYYYNNGKNHSDKWIIADLGWYGWQFYITTTTKPLVDRFLNPIPKFDETNLPTFKWFEKGKRYQ